MALKHIKKEAKQMDKRGRRVPACVYEDMSKMANLPMDVVMEDYPSFPSVPQYLDDSINYIDRQVNAGVKGMTRQILDKSY